MSAPAYDFVAAELKVAVTKVGLSADIIRAAVENHDLIAHYAGTKPVFLAVDLASWIESLPTERPVRSA